MATINVTKRVFNQSTGLFEYHKVGEGFNTYKEALEHFNGQQDWFNKHCHRFTANGDLYYMNKESE